jgi:T-complex protein 1 subunit beta
VSDPNNIRITITNDGATILKSVPVENPAAKVLVDIAKIQDDTVGDGTTRYQNYSAAFCSSREFTNNELRLPFAIV